MYSQPHGSLPPHIQGSPGQNEYHSSMRGEYLPSPEGYYPMPPHMTPPMHPHYYDYPPPPHYLPYHPGAIGPPMPHPDDYDRGVIRRYNGANNSGTPASSSSVTAAGGEKGKTSKGNGSPSAHKSKFRKDRFGSFEAPAGREEEDRRSYNLKVCQQPLRARMCGFGEKDRRPIDPPPIVQLVVNDEKGSPDPSMLQNPFFVLHVTLWSEDGRQERNVISNPPKTTRVLMGSLVSSPALLKNTEGEQGCYFCFPDLSIRTEGTYTLKFSLMKLGNGFSEDRLIDTKSCIIATTFSDQFTVFSAKKFPGMTESTELSKTFAKQGLKIPIRNDVRPRKVTEEVPAV
ncbi:hypothetical protein G9A89_017822 [Geosiphon pyriformis]|nr:hypothetical protein G9A89_017822 [Geosiphon pyriformis]